MGSHAEVDSRGPGRPAHGRRTNGAIYVTAKAAVTHFTRLPADLRHRRECNSPGDTRAERCVGARAAVSVIAWEPDCQVSPERAMSRLTRWWMPAGLPVPAH
jgi:hypothetical protein